MKKGIIAGLSSILGVAIGAGIAGRAISKDVRNYRDYSDKHLQLFLMMNQWVKSKQENKSIAEYLEKNGYVKVAIYGMSYAGETLVNELAGSNIKVEYGIDKNAVGASIEVVSPEDELDEVDAVIVTAVTFFEEIEELLMGKMTCPILSLEDILYEM